MNKIWDCYKKNTKKISEISYFKNNSNYSGKYIKKDKI